MSESSENFENIESVPEVAVQERESEIGSEGVDSSDSIVISDSSKPEPFDFSAQSDVADFLLSLGVDTYHVPTTPYECFTLGLRAMGLLIVVFFAVWFFKFSFSFLSGKWLK